ncbi:hypothetical protein V6N13_076268 [Hibiscus sabdariffa]
MLAVVMAWPRSMAYLEVVWRALVASLLCVAVDGCGVFSFACFAQGMTALWLWRCTACMAVSASASTCAGPPWLCVRTFAAIGGTALAIRWLLCGIAPSSRYLVQQDVKPLGQGTHAL